MPPLREDSGGDGGGGSTAVTQFGDHWWGEICKKSRRAVVFIDNAAAECLHWHGGLLRLERHGGVEAVKELSSFEAGGEGQKKAVFVVDGPVVGLRAEKIGEILRGSHFEHCAVITNASPSVNNLARHPGRDNLPERHTFDELENTLLEWMGDFNYTAEVFYMPFCTAAISPRLFVFPPASDLFPLLETDLRRATDLARLLGTATAASSSETEAAPQLEYASLPPETQVVAQHFVSSLNALFQAIDVAEDVFSVGAFSKMLGSRLEQLASARNRRKVATKKASLILIDRSLDLATPSRCRFDSLLDRIRAALPALPGHSNDVQIEMARLFEMEQGVTKKGALCPGCLSDCLDVKGLGGRKDLVGNFIMESEDTAISNILTELEKVPSVGNLPSGDDDDIARLRSGVRRLVGERRDIAANINVVQKAVAAVQAFGSSGEDDKLSYLAKLQEEFAAALNESEDEAKGFLVEIVKMVRGRRERGVTLDDVLVLLVYVYGSIPSGTEFYPEDEDRLQSVFSEAVVQDREGLGAVLNSMAKGTVIDEILAHQMVETVFKKLRCLPAARSNTGFRDIGDGLVAKLMREIYSDDRHDVEDLFHHGQGLVGKSLSLFGVRVSRLHPRENPTVVVVLVGGITASEVRQIHQIVREKSSSVELLVGATRMISPHECSAALFQKDPLHLGSEQ